MHEECGVFGVFHPGEDVANLTYFGLYALQHRGQESAGIAVSDGAADPHAQGDGAGLAGLRPGDIDALQRPHRGRPHALQHHGKHPAAQRAAHAVQHPQLGPVVVAHNGNLVNARRCATSSRAQGVDFETDQRHRGARRAAGAHPRRVAGRGAGRCAAPRRGRVLPAVPHPRLAGRRARPAGHPAAVPGPLRRRRRARAAAATSSPARRARSTSSAPRSSARSSPVRSSPWTGIGHAQHAHPAHGERGARCAPSSSSTSRGRTA